MLAVLAIVKQFALLFRSIGLRSAFLSKHISQSYHESQIAGRYNNVDWASTLLKQIEAAEPIAAKTELIFRKKLRLGDDAQNIFSLGVPFRLYSHQTLDLKVFYYNNKKLGSYPVKCELLAFNNTFSAAIYYLNANHSIDELKKAIRAKYLYGQSNIKNIEDRCIVDLNENQFLLTQVGFSRVIIYHKKDFLRQLVGRLEFHAAVRTKVVEDERFSRIFDEI